MPRMVSMRSLVGASGAFYGEGGATISGGTMTETPFVPGGAPPSGKNTHNDALYGGTGRATPKKFAHASRDVMRDGPAGTAPPNDTEKK